MPLRQFDPVIARWTTIDPVTHYSSSTYAGFNNNPIYFLDPSGGAGMSHNLKIQGFDGKWHTIGQDQIKFQNVGGEITIDAAEHDPYASMQPLEEHDNLSTGGSGGGSFWSSIKRALGIGPRITSITSSEHSLTADELAIAMAEPSIAYPPDTRNKIRKATVEPTITKFLEVEGNSLAVVDMIRQSKIGNFVRGGRPAAEGIGKALKGTGNLLGGIGIVYGIKQYANDEISGYELTVDTVIGGAAIVTSLGTGALLVAAAPWVAGGALVYFVGKAVYEYSSGETLFEKP